VQVDTLLDELAATCPFSETSLRNPNARSKLDVLKALYKNMPPLDAQFLTQIILKDLRPVLYPLPAMHYTAALKEYNSKSVHMLCKADAVRVWHSVGGVLMNREELKVGEFIEVYYVTALRINELTLPMSDSEICERPGMCTCSPDL
jgi:DNA ligase-4